MATPVKTLRSQSADSSKVSENSNPNVSIPSTPVSIKSSKSKKLTSKTPQNPSRIRSPPPPPKPLERKFIVAKKNSRKGERKDLDPKKCQQSAYEALRASQDDFFKKDGVFGGTEEGSKVEFLKKDEVFGAAKEELKAGSERDQPEKSEVQEVEGGSTTRKLRSLVMEEALSSVPEPGSGRVKHLVKAFETLVSISDEDEGEKVERRKLQAVNWALPGLGHPLMKGLENELAAVEFLPSRDFERDPRLCSSWDSNGNRLSLGSRTSSRRNSSDSSRGSWNKKLRVTSQQPFKLRTEQRGRLKEEQFIRKVKEMIVEEEKKRIPIAQGLPWTTDEPECLAKPPVKERTEPLDIVLHSDIRAEERAEFDHYVAERLGFIEQIKLERERQRKLEEEEEIRRLRRELVPKAQPMPYFDRPFLPKKSARPRTVPKEPRFHVRQ